MSNLFWYNVWLSNNVTLGQLGANLSRCNPIKSVHRTIKGKLLVVHFTKKWSSAFVIWKLILVHQYSKFLKLNFHRKSPSQKNPLHRSRKSCSVQELYLSLNWRFNAFGSVVPFVTSSTYLSYVYVSSLSPISKRFFE